MTSDTTPGTPGPSTPAQDWAAWLTATLGRYVGIARDRAIRPLVSLAAFLALGLGIAGLVLGGALAGTVLAAVAVSRAVNVYLFRSHMWATDTFVGGIFLLAGVLLVA
ncbi:MAG TPA: hypothetical protein VMD59_24675, partial [Acidimicrobiales bacterium]|nr:hypothetical protein [Acidimicrobiales bacterium]